MQTANKFTLCRILCAPVFYLLYFMPLWFAQFPFLSHLSVYLMLLLLAFAELTDYLDGKFARMRNQVTDFGKIFDPFADVFLNLTVFFCLVLSSYLPAIILLFIIYREISMMFIRMVAMQEGVAIAARMGGKVKTVTYIITFFFTLLIESSIRLELLDTGDSLIRTGKTISLILFSVCLVLSYASFIDYLINFRKVLPSKK